MTRSWVHAPVMKIHPYTNTSQPRNTLLILKLLGSQKRANLRQVYIALCMTPSADTLGSGRLKGAVTKLCVCVFAAAALELLKMCTRKLIVMLFRQWCYF